ncbi:SapC family protein [uncultured Rhodospira sp.]|uniref:SapC family protein n=1 Tax=uncultured Rhodospira sp. TaxID=1936189 RepID=UPI002605C4FC|nr:SapC family protein [uncultured Rhodospira sp.]
MFIPLRTTEPSHRLFTPHADYKMARSQPIVPLARTEVPRAVLAFPIAFQATAEGASLVAVMGLTTERNLFVTADNRWAGAYVPAIFRGYPFALGNTEDGRQVVCIDEDSGCLREGPGAKPLFDENDQPAPFLREIMGFLQQLARDRQATMAGVATLEKHGLLEAWPITIKAGERETNVTGLLRINESALNALEPAALAEVRDAGALPIAYGQLYSMGHLRLLGKMAEAHAKAAEQMQQKMHENASMFRDDDISFNFD